MTVKLTVDNRESHLIKLLDVNSIQFDVKQLELGDIVFQNEDDEIILIIERKTLCDLKASICDGRLREQRSRLLSNYDTKRIMYIIEGDLNSVNKTLNTDTLVGSIVNMQLRDSIIVHKTMNITETMKYIVKMKSKLEKDLTEYFKDNRTVTKTEYCSTIKTKKKSNMTPDVWFITQLALLPNITEYIAESIMSKYESLPNLIKEYEAINEDKRPKMLSDIIYNNKNNNTRRIGDKNSEKIYNYLYNNVDYNKNYKKI